MHRRGAEGVGDSSEGPPQPGAVRLVGEMEDRRRSQPSSSRR
jgi:hypothetical protein